MRTGTFLLFLIFAACTPDYRADLTVGCGNSTCGCSHPDNVALSGRTIDGTSKAAISGINVLCDGEAEPIGASDSKGYFRADVQTLRSPGCGLTRCDVIRFSDPAGRFRDELYGEFELGGDVALTRR